MGGDFAEEKHYIFLFVAKEYRPFGMSLGV